MRLCLKILKNKMTPEWDGGRESAPLFVWFVFVLQLRGVPELENKTLRISVANTGGEDPPKHHGVTLRGFKMIYVRKNLNILRHTCVSICVLICVNY